MAIKKVSRNPEEHPRVIRVLVESIANVFYDGDLDAAWKSAFDSLDEFENMPVVEADQKDARIHVRVPRSQ